jgi:hypothetical protein
MLDRLILFGFAAYILLCIAGPIYDRVGWVGIVWYVTLVSGVGMITGLAWYATKRGRP